MFLSPFVTSFIYVCKAYQAACYELPLAESGERRLRSGLSVNLYAGGYRELQRGSKEYKQQIEQNYGSETKKSMQAFLEQMKIRSDLIIFQSRVQSYASHGANFWTKYDAVITAPYVVASPKTVFFLKREIFHIKYNRSVMVNLLPAIFSAFSATICALYSTPVISATLVSIIVGMLAKRAFLKLYEGLADYFAIQHSTVQELLAVKEHYNKSKDEEGVQAVQGRLSMMWNQHRLAKIEKGLVS